MAFSHSLLLPLLSLGLLSGLCGCKKYSRGSAASSDLDSADPAPPQRVCSLLPQGVSEAFFEFSSTSGSPFYFYGRLRGVETYEALGGTLMQGDFEGRIELNGAAYSVSGRLESEATTVAEGAVVRWRSTAGEVELEMSGMWIIYDRVSDEEGTRTGHVAGVEAAQLIKRSGSVSYGMFLPDLPGEGDGDNDNGGNSGGGSGSDNEGEESGDNGGGGTSGGGTGTTIKRLDTGVKGAVVRLLFPQVETKEEDEPAAAATPIQSPQPYRVNP